MTGFPTASLRGSSTCWQSTFRHVAVEVKPSTAPEEDITRGIFQCVKYQAVMDASRVADYGNYDNEVILVLAGEMSKSNKQLAEDLDIKFIENFASF